MPASRPCRRRRIRLTRRRPSGAPVMRSVLRRAALHVAAGASHNECAGASSPASRRARCQGKATGRARCHRRRTAGPACVSALHVLAGRISGLRLSRIWLRLLLRLSGLPIGRGYSSRHVIVTRRFSAACGSVELSGSDSPIACINSLLAGMPRATRPRFTASARRPDSTRLANSSPL